MLIDQSQNKIKKKSCFKRDNTPPKSRVLKINEQSENKNQEEKIVEEIKEKHKKRI